VAICKKGQPGRPCCTPTNCQVCFTVTGCCEPLANATVQIYECNAPSTILHNGTTNSNGRYCVDLTNSNSNGKILCATVSYPTDYLPETNSLLGWYCVRNYDISLQPGVVGSGNAGTAGKLTVTLIDESNAPVTSGTAYVVDPLDPLNFVASGTMGANGVVTFTGIATNTNRFFRGPNLQNFPTFQIACEGVASAKYADLGIGQEWSLTQVDCDVPTNGRVCCDVCTPSTIPLSLTLTDPSANWAATNGTNGACGPPTAANAVAMNYAAFACDVPDWCNARIQCGTVAPGYSGQSGTASSNANSYTGASFYSLWCDGTNSTWTLQVTSGVQCFCECCSYTFPTTNCTTCVKTLRGQDTNGPFTLWTVSATSITCDPFSLTFDLNAVSGGFVSCTGPCHNATSCGNWSYPARTITITE
jgi:hypothetical protein